MKKAVLTILILFMSITMTGCEHSPGPPYLNSVASNTLPGFRENWYNQTLYIEEDNYGRTLFAFSTSYMGRKLLSLMILQARDNNYSYYYDDVNYIYCYPIDDSSIATKEDVFDQFTEEDISNLKRVNSWNKPLTYEKMIAVKIKKSRMMYSLGLGDYNTIREITGLSNDSEVQSDYGELYNIGFSKDKNGKQIYCIYSSNTKILDEHEVPKIVALAMYNQVGFLIDAVELKDVWDFRKEVIQLKNENDWTPLTYSDAIFDWVPLMVIVGGICMAVVATLWLRKRLKKT